MLLSHDDDLPGHTRRLHHLVHSHGVEVGASVQRLGRGHHCGSLRHHSRLGRRKLQLRVGAEDVDGVGRVGQRGGHGGGARGERAAHELRERELLLADVEGHDLGEQGGVGARLGGHGGDGLVVGDEHGGLGEGSEVGGLVLVQADLQVRQEGGVVGVLALVADQLVDFCPHGRRRLGIGGGENEGAGEGEE